MSAWDVVDAVADPSQIVGADVRLAIARTIEGLILRDGEVSAATLRPLLEAEYSPDLLDKRMPAMLSSAVKKGLLRRLRLTVSGNGRSRNAHKPIWVYHAPSREALAEWVARYEGESLTIRELAGGAA